MAETLARLLKLLSLLQGRRDWSGTELSERLGVSPRTVRRDIERLRDLGYPVHGTTGPTGSYRLEAGTATPPLLLEDDEAVAIAIGLRTVAGGTIEGIEEISIRALAKLEQVLPSQLRHRVNSLHSATVTMTASITGPTVDPNILTALAAACRDHQRVRFTYRDGDGAETTRLTEPQRLVSAGRRWYLVAWDVNREDWRTFRVDRIRAPETTRVRATPRKLPAKDAAAYVAQALSAWRPADGSAVIVHAPRAAVADRIRHSEGQLEAIDEHTCRIYTVPENLEWLAFRISLLGIDFDVDGPPEAAERIRTIGHRLVRGAG